MVRVGWLKRLQGDLERVMELKKLHLIDQAIDDLGGKWPSDDLMSIFLHQGTPMIGYVASRWSSVKGLRFIGIRPEFKLRKAERQRKPDWSKTPAWANWIAQDEEGRWFWYSKKPEVDDLEFVELSDEGKVAFAASGGEVIGDWRHTLEQRPANSSCVADGLREIREAFTDWGIHLAGAQVTHKGTTPNGMNKLEVTVGENHIVESDEKVDPELEFAGLIKDVYPRKAAAIYCKRIQSAIDNAEIEKAAKACERALDEFFPKAKLADLVDWYDYDNQKALSLPPVGEVCQMYAAASWFDVKMIAEDDGKPIVKYLGCGNYYPAAPTKKFYRPLDWDRNQKPKPDPSPELSFHLSNAFNELQAGARLLPEDDARKQVLVSLASGVGVMREGV